MDYTRHPEALSVAPVPDRLDAALRYLVNEKFIAGTRYRDQQARADRRGAHPDIIAFERAFVRRMKKLGVPVFAHNMVRNHAQQGRLFVQGVSKARPGESPHNHGKAVDIVHGIRAWEIPRPCWDLFGHIGHEVAKQLGVKVQWGGTWKFYDPAHWELEDWRHYPLDPAVSSLKLEQILKLYDLA